MQQSATLNPVPDSKRANPWVDALRTPLALGLAVLLGMQAIIFITATLAAIGAAAIPGAGLVTMGIVLTAAGLPLDGIGLILAIDRVLDQFRTAVNVWGDCTAAVVIGRLENAITDVDQMEEVLIEAEG